MKKRILAMVLVIMLAISSISELVFAEVFSAKDCIDHMRSTYNKALNNAGFSDFNGWCGACVARQLEALGITVGCDGGNGNSFWGKYKDQLKTTGGYDVVSYDGGKYTIKDVLNNINNIDGYTYTILCFQTGVYEEGHAYGHVLLIYAVHDNVVYYNESFGDNPRNCSINYFCDKYKQNGEDYNYSGAVYFKDPNNSQQGIFDLIEKAKKYIQEQEEILNNLDKYAESDEVVIDITAKPGNNFVPKAFDLKGSITSNKSNITKINARLYRFPLLHKDNIISSYTFSPSRATKSYDIGGSDLDRAIKFERIKQDGGYILEITAVNANNKKKTEYYPFTVTIPKNITAPTISPSSIEGGQRVTASCSDSGALIHLTVGGTTVTGYRSVSKDLTSQGTYNVSAYTSKSGYNSSHKVYSVSVQKAPTPVISDAVFGASNAFVTISGSGEIHYTLDGSTPTKYSPTYTGPIYLTESKTVKAVSYLWGYANSNTAEKWENISVPDAVSVNLSTKDKVAQGKSVTATWNGVPRATGYKAYIYLNGTPIKQFNTKNYTASFVLDERSDTVNFEYKIKVYAYNFKGNSPESNNVTVWGMHPLKVTFYDRILTDEEFTKGKLADVKAKLNAHYSDDSGEKIEGQVISVQKVDYDEYSSRPAIPSKHGFTFAGWSSELYKKITEDANVYAEYEINRYNVKFYDAEELGQRGRLLSSKTYFYTDSAELPENYALADGYIFSGWNVDASKSDCYDLNFIDGNMVLDISYKWKNEELPVFLKITNVTRYDKSYKVNLQMKNNPVKDTQGRIVVALYTKDGRNVYTQIIDKDYDLGKMRDWTDQDEITLLYDKKASYMKAFMVAVVNNKTAGTLSEATEFNNIIYDSNSHFWTDWQPEEISGEKIETKTQYRYRDKRFETSTTTKKLSGWIYYGSTPRVGNWTYNGSGYVAAFENDNQKREVSVTWVPATYKTQYNYYGYKWSDGNRWHFCPTLGAHYWGGTFNYIETGWLDYTLPYYTMTNQYCGHCGTNMDHYWRDEPNKGNYYYFYNTRDVQTGGGYNTYSYRDTYYTHNFYQWGEYSEWSDEKPSAAENREIETRTMYRTITNEEHEATADEGFVETVSGNFDCSAIGYVTEAELSKKTYSVISGPYYKTDSDEDEYILISENQNSNTQYRFGRYTNGTYIMPCKEAAEEIYGGEWQLEYTEWSDNEEDSVTENVYSCEEYGHNHIGNTSVWNEYSVNGEQYCFKESRILNTPVTYTDKNKYYLVNLTLEGEVATIMVYKKTNTDPTEEQLEYVDQQPLGVDGSYNFTIKTKEKLDYEKTGDFVVAIALEGGERLTNVDYFKADLPEYTVDFSLPSGELYKSVKVELGGSVDVNEIGIPEVTGYRFVKWDKSVVNITGDLKVKAEMLPEKYAVMYVDYENATSEIKELYYGEPIPAPEVAHVEGKIFKGWDNISYRYVTEEEKEQNGYEDFEGLYYKQNDTYIPISEFDENAGIIEDTTRYYRISEGTMNVTGNCIVTAQWETQMYTVKFCDLQGNVVDEQQVAYGRSAVMPDFVEDDGITYLWDLTGAQWWNVKTDMYIYPFTYDETAPEAPIIDVPTTDVYGIFAVELKAADEESKIYYSDERVIEIADAEQFVENLNTEKNAQAAGIEETVLTSNEDDETTESAIKEYTEPIIVGEGSILYAFTVDANGRISPISVFEYEKHDENEEDPGITPYNYVPDSDVTAVIIPVVSANPGETVTVPITLQANPGLDNLELLVYYNSQDLTLDSVENGEIFSAAEFSKDVRDDGSCKFRWVSDKSNTNNGNLLYLTFTVKDTADKEGYLIDIEVENSHNGSEESDVISVPGLIKYDKELRYGDVNGDNSADIADAVMIIRYDIGLTNFTDEQKLYGDVNADGDVDFADAIRILRFDAGFLKKIR